jgi:hypothetical protein
MARSRSGRRSDGVRVAVAVALALAGLGAMAAPVPASASSAAAGRPAAGRPAAAWARYVDAPASRDVRPVRVLSSAGDVTSPGGALGHGVATLTATAPPVWPGGTTATASSYHAPNTGDNGQPRSYVPGNAIDGNTDTFWNDATPATYPATLTITAPSAVSLPGITVLSNSDGVPVDYTVSTWNGTAWVTQATVTGNSAIEREVPFPQPVSTTQVEITVTQDQNTPQGEYTRINEVYPGLVPPAPSVTLDFGKDVVGYPPTWPITSDPTAGSRPPRSTTTRSRSSTTPCGGPSTAAGAVSHPQDGNGLAVIAGVASPSRAASALSYLAKATAQPYGNAFMDNDSLVSDGSQRVYAFTSFPEIEARFTTGQAASALDEIGRLYGWMNSHDPGLTDWEGIGAGGSMYEGASRPRRTAGPPESFPS